MIGLDSPQNEIPNHLLEVPGSFAWWYLDIIGNDGCGAVIIWGYGLPFLPQRSSVPPHQSAANNHPSLTISIYDRGVESFYLFQEFEQSDTKWISEFEQLSEPCEDEYDRSNPAQKHIQRWNFGDTTIVSEKSDGQVRLTLKLQCKVPADCSDLVGTINCSGNIRPCISMVVSANGEAIEKTQQNDPRHQWTPVLTKTDAQVNLTCSQQHWQFNGRAYHDRNAGQIPLQQLGIRIWWWGRAALPAGELIWYQLHPTTSSEKSEILNYAIWCSDRETIVFEHISCVFGGQNHGKYGLASPKLMTLMLPSIANQSHPNRIEVELAHCIDDSPFYQRTILKNSGRSIGFAEQIRPGRIGTPWQQPFVRMRVHSLRNDDKNSMWLPLFSGPVKGRWKRLIRYLFSTALRKIGLMRPAKHPQNKN